MHVILTSENEKEWGFKAVLQPGAIKQGTVVEGGRLNMRETEYTVTMDDGHAWTAVLLAMPNRRYSWHIADGQHSTAGASDYHSSPMLTLRDGVIPYIVTQELKEYGAGRQ